MDHAHGISSSSIDDAERAGLRGRAKMRIGNGRNRASMISGMRLLAFKQAVDARGNDMSSARPSNLKKDLADQKLTLEIFQPRLATRQARGLSMWGVGVRSAGHGEW